MIYSQIFIIKTGISYASLWAEGDPEGAFSNCFLPAGRRPVAAYILPRTIPAAIFSLNLLQKDRVPDRAAHRRKVPPVPQPGDPHHGVVAGSSGRSCNSGRTHQACPAPFPGQGPSGRAEPFHPDNISGSVCRNAADFLRNSSHTGKAVSIRPGHTLSGKRKGRSWSPSQTVLFANQPRGELSISMLLY